MILSADSITMQYNRKNGSRNFFEAVNNVSLSLQPGKITVITGKSGSGKSTLLYILAGLLTPTKGTVSLDGTNLYSLSDKDLSALRNKTFGIIPQGQTGLFSMNVIQNVLLPSAIYNNSESYVQKAKELLERTGIADLADSRLNELSGGEMRRMAIARALLLNPSFIFADEPTDDLDEQSTTSVLELLKEYATNGSRILLVTHEKEAESYADELYKMTAGTLTKMR